MSSSALILHAHSRVWTAAWQRLVVANVDRAVPKILSSSLTECRQQLDKWPRSWVGVEVTAETLEEVLPWLVRVERDFPRAAVGALVDADVRCGTYPLQEAGAVHCCVSIPELVEVAGWVRRHLQFVSDSVDHDPITARIAAARAWPDDLAKTQEAFDGD